MLNAAEMAAGAIGATAGAQLDKLIERVKGEEQLDTKHVHGLLIEMRDDLRLIAHRLSPAISPPENDTVQLQPYPSIWPVPHYRRAHFCIFIPSGVSGSAGAYTPTVTSAKLYIFSPGIGIIIKTLSPGWNQLDLPPQTEISTADGQNYTVIYSFRDDAIGASI